MSLCSYVKCSRALSGIYGGLIRRTIETLIYVLVCAGTILLKPGDERAMMYYSAGFQAKNIVELDYCSGTGIRTVTGKLIWVGWIEKRKVAAVILEMGQIQRTGEMPVEKVGSDS